ncbi:DsbA family protein [Granulicella cerasi]|uniref:DsbA family protein n=1 Tax=Granulicella cerasi TaxID=741063 RepID=A0ABW1ZBF3_9BACT|nr:DsbA family protein [Granulicella cerasi]
MLRHSAAAVVLSLALAGTAYAQTSVPPNQVSAFHDTSMLKPPAGAKVAILEWEDLECPACGHAFPIVHSAAAHYHIPIVERDFPLQMHIWSKKAALYARYMHDKISPDFALEYRREVFASQFRISSMDDLESFTRTYMQKGGKQLPFVVDPDGKLQKEIDADFNLGVQLNITETPTIIVATAHHWIQVKDVSQLYTAIDQANALAAKEGPATPAKAPVARKK